MISKSLRLFLFAMILSCAQSDTTYSEDCETSYASDDPTSEMEDELIANVKFVVFVDSLNEYINTEVFYKAVETLNNDFSVTRKRNLKLGFRLLDVEKIVSPENKKDFPGFLRHAMQYYSDELVDGKLPIVIYVYGDSQPYLTGRNAGIKGKAADIPSRTLAIRNSFVNSSTITHEVGHCLGLLHIHQPDYTDGYNTMTGDLVCDTKSGSLAKFVTGDCNYVGPEISPPDTPRKYECNFMSYISPECRTCLTDGQIARMYSMIQNTTTLRRCFGLTVSEL